MVFWISILSIPIFLFLGIMFVAVGRTPPNEQGRGFAERVSTLVQVLICLGTWSLCVNGMVRLLEEYRIMSDAGFLQFTIPTIGCWALGCTCWVDGYWKGKSRGTSDLMRSIQESERKRSESTE